MVTPKTKPAAVSHETASTLQPVILGVQSRMVAGTCTRADPRQRGARERESSERFEVRDGLGRCSVATLLNFGQCADHASCELTGQ
jgi:hypothetical protein